MNRCIAIGDGATVSKDLEICIKTSSLEMREQMTEEEHRVISALLHRMIRKTYPKHDSHKIAWNTAIGDAPSTLRINLDGLQPGGSSK